MVKLRIITKEEAQMADWLAVESHKLERWLSKPRTVTEISEDFDLARSTIQGVLARGMRRGIVSRRNEPGVQRDNFRYSFKENSVNHIDEDDAEDEDEEEEPQQPRRKGGEAAAKTMRENSMRTALAIRELFLKLRDDNSALSEKQLIELTVERHFELDRFDRPVYVANSKKPLHPATIRGYLHGHITARGGSIVVGEDLIPKTKREGHKFYGNQHQAVSLTPLLDRLDAIDSHLQALAEGRTEYQVTLMEKVTELISLWSDEKTA